MFNVPDGNMQKRNPYNCNIKNVATTIRVQNCFPSNSGAKVSELLESLKRCFLHTKCIIMCMCMCIYVYVCAYLC